MTTQRLGSGKLAELRAAEWYYSDGDSNEGPHTVVELSRLFDASKSSNGDGGPPMVRDADRPDVVTAVFPPISASAAAAAEAAASSPPSRSVT